MPTGVPWPRPAGCTAAAPTASWPGCAAAWAQYSNIDATLLRVLFVVLALLGGPGLVIYLLMWILVPEEPLGAA